MYLMKKGQNTYSMVKVVLKNDFHQNQGERNSLSHSMVVLNSKLI
ncbi:unnamed protein product [Callosobruchus maculatus]|uniref:Uncharacterized protein n=1 Tax=Callosobruchus maculatus TaxID=64391 RepID=A0A653CN87_CALMS|nr:unnamed protein product [Callosobruchus maculatus]